MVLKYSPPLLVLALGAALSRQSGFNSPNFVEPYGPGAYENVDVWYVGQTKEVAYDITDVSGLDKYTIALWQQALGGGGATLGPVVDSECSAGYPDWHTYLVVQSIGHIDDRSPPRHKAPRCQRLLQLACPTVRL